MSKALKGKRQRGEDAAQQPEARTSFSAPLGTLQQARLVVVSGGSGLELAGDAALPDLFQARFGPGNPHVWLQDGVVTVKYSPRRLSVAKQQQPQARIALNSAIKWEVELRHDVSRLQATLAQLQLGSLDILGSASHCRLTLSPPSGTAFIYIAGAASHITFSVPPGCGIRLRTGGAASGLLFDGQRVRNASNETQLQNAAFDDATSRYDIYIAGAASNLTVERRA